MYLLAQNQVFLSVSYIFIMQRSLWGQKTKKHFFLYHTYPSHSDCLIKKFWNFRAQFLKFTCIHQRPNFELENKCVRWSLHFENSYSRIKVENQTRFIIAQFLAIVKFKPSQHRLKFGTEEAAWIQAAGDGTAGRLSAKNWLKLPIFLFLYE